MKRNNMMKATNVQILIKRMKGPHQMVSTNQYKASRPARQK